MPTPRALQSSGNIVKYRAEEYWQILLVWFRNPQVHDWLWHGLCIFPPSVSDELRGMKKCARELMELKMRQHTQNAATCVQHTVGFMITRFRRRGKSSQISIQQRFGPWIYYKQFSASRGPISLPRGAPTPVLGVGIRWPSRPTPALCFRIPTDCWLLAVAGRGERVL